jgi:hypothetical protein
MGRKQVGRLRLWFMRFAGLALPQTHLPWS